MSCPAPPYASLMYANSFFECIPESDWNEYCNDDRISALYNTALTLDARYGECYEAYMLDPEYQPMLWPRTGFVQKDGRCISSGSIPAVLQRANCMLAIKSLRASHIEEESSSPSPGRQIKSHTMKEDGIYSETITYEDGDVVDNENSMEVFTGNYGWDEIDMLMDPILYCCPGECGANNGFFTVDLCRG